MNSQELKCLIVTIIMLHYCKVTTVLCFEVGIRKIGLKLQHVKTSEPFSILAHPPFSFFFSGPPSYSKFWIRKELSFLCWW